jgi:hypothetical protein
VQSVLEVVILEHGLDHWEWCVCDRKGTIIMNGFEATRRVAKYRGEWALFSLLVSGWD